LTDCSGLPFSPSGSLWVARCAEESARSGQGILIGYLL
jgi:hypothetical protein